MRIVRTETTVKISSGEDISRVVTKSQITWYGLDVNYRKRVGCDSWECTFSNNFVLCGIPKYELDYQELIS